MNIFAFEPLDKMSEVWPYQVGVVFGAPVDRPNARCVRRYSSPRNISINSLKRAGSLSIYETIAIVWSFECSAVSASRISISRAGRKSSGPDTRRNRRDPLRSGEADCTLKFDRTGKGYRS